MQFIDNNHLTEQQIAVKYQIEKEMLECLKTIKTSPKVKIWSENERILSEEEILKKYSEYYSILIQSKYNKKLHKEQIIVSVGKSGYFYPEGYFSKIIVRLSAENVGILKVWAREGYKVLKEYFYDKDMFSLREIRFDFLLDQEGIFILPDMPLDSVTLTRTLKENKTINIVDYINSKIITTAEIESIQKLWNSNTSN